MRNLVVVIWAFGPGLSRKRIGRSSRQHLGGANTVGSAHLTSFALNTGGGGRHRQSTPHHTHSRTAGTRTMSRRPGKRAAHKPPGIAGAAGILLARLTSGGEHAISGSRKTEAIKMSTRKEPSAMSATTEKKRPRSAVTSGRKLLIGGDPNSAWSRRYRDLAVRHISDLGGRDMLSEAQLSLARRAAALACELEQMEARMSQG